MEWVNPNKCQSDESDIYCDLEIVRAGLYRFYIQGQDGNTYCHGSFIVDPELLLPSKKVHLDSIVMQTVLVKSLGPLSQWKSRLEVAYKTGYNK